MDSLPDLVFRVGRPTEELRYAIRSQVQHVKHRTVWTAGVPVPWLTCPHINVPKNATKMWHAHAVLRAILNHDELTPTVIISDDDMYALEPVPGAPNYTRGPIGTIAPISRHQAFADTAAIAGTSAPCLDTHTPTLIDRARLAAQLDGITTLPDERKVRLLWRTIHGPSGPTVDHPDVKLRTPADPWPEGPWVSTSDTAFRGRPGERIRAAFPGRSPWETRGRRP